MIKMTYRNTLLASTIIAGLAVSSPAFAQDNTQQPAGTPSAEPSASPPAADNGLPAGVQTQDSAGAAEETSAGDIVVTGTLIKNPNLVSSSPVSVVGQEELSLRQTNNAEEVLRELPGSTPSIGSAVNNGNLGAAYADLRGLGNFRNVVLIDGVRITPSNTIGRVDLNNVPLALIERVDTLTGGAATTYGADAVSGVINFITRQDFAGAEIAASEQITGKGDGNIFRVDATIGANFDDGRGNAVLSIGYQEADAVYQGARRFGISNYTSTGGAAGGSSTTVPGRFTLGTSNFVVDPTSATLKPYVGSRDAFNFNPYNIYQTPFKRYNIYGAGHYEVADGIELYARGMFSKNSVATIVAPSGIFAQVVAVPVSSPFLSASQRAQFCANNDFDPFTAGIQTITPAQCTAAASATSLSDPNFRFFTTTVGRRTPETGVRNQTFVTQFFDYRTGVRIGVTDNINLDISGAYGESENTRTRTGFVLVSHIRTAVFTSSATSCNLGPSPLIPNPNPLLGPLAAAGAGTNGCVPVNIFGANGSITPAMVPYLTGNSTETQVSSLAQARALLNGDFGVTSPWADDAIGFAIGGEYRRYQASQRPDALSQTAGELGGAGGAILPFEGGYHVYEAYGELIAPIVQDKPFFKTLTLEAGIRYSAYTVEAPSRPSYNTTTWKAAATWEPVSGLKFRGNYQRAVRAPNINELFAPTVVGLTNLSGDPCRTTRDSKTGAITYAGPLTNANLRAVCIMQGAPASSIGNITDPVAGQANSTTAGGLYLRPETANSYTIGAVFQPAMVPGLSVTVDYYNIKIKNAISQPSPDDVVRNCFGDSSGSAITAASVNNPLCQLFRRDPVLGTLSGDPATTGGLVMITSNAGLIKTDGIDFGLNYRRDIGFARLNLSFNGNWTHKSSFQALAPGAIIPPGYPGAGTAVPPSIPRECVGFYSTSCGSPGSAGPNSAPGSLQPEFTWMQRTTLSLPENVDVSLLWRHLSKMRAEPGVKRFAGTIGVGALAGEQVDFGHIPAYDYFDLATRFGVGDNFDLTLTVQNLFNKQPPIVGGNSGNTAYNSGNTFPSTYDALGRRFAIGGRLKF